MGERRFPEWRSPYLRAAPQNVPEGPPGVARMQTGASASLNLPGPESTFQVLTI